MEMEAPRSTAMTIRKLKAANEDWEFYPSTDEIIGVVAKDIASRYRDGGWNRKTHDMLDVGAGDGRVLKRVSECVNRMLDKEHRTIGNLYAIEKATTHIMDMPKDIVIIGTDFHEQTLIDKRMGYIFSNPPYSEYEEWVVKLVREACADYLYLVIPERWKKSVEINKAIKIRRAQYETLGDFDFEDADRQARAKVNVVRISLRPKTKNKWNHDCGDEPDDPFDRAIEEMLPELKMFDRMDNEAPVPEDDTPPQTEVVEGGEGIVETMVKAYNSEVSSMIDTYRAVVKINPYLLKELGVGKKDILTGLRSKVTGCKEKYWKNLFDSFKPITERLATRQRKEFLESLNGKAAIDFTEDNIYAMLLWITKWANDHFDTQVIDLFRALTELCNVTNYKSNQRTWKNGQWRYGGYDMVDEDGNTASSYKLEYRIVLHRSGGITCGSSWERQRFNGLTERAGELLTDCVTVANNLNFPCDDGPRNHQWSSNKKNTLMLLDGKPLVSVRAFQNGNMHWQFNPKVILAINVEAGRLLGWLKDPVQAAEEMNATPEEAEQIKQVFSTSFRIGARDLLGIGQS